MGLYVVDAESFVRELLVDIDGGISNGARHHDTDIIVEISLPKFLNVVEGIAGNHTRLRIR